MSYSTLDLGTVIVVDYVKLELIRPSVALPDITASGAGYYSAIAVMGAHILIHKAFIGE